MIMDVKKPIQIIQFVTLNLADVDHCQMISDLQVISTEMMFAKGSLTRFMFMIEMPWLAEYLLAVLDMILVLSLANAGEDHA